MSYVACSSSLYLLLASATRRAAPTRPQSSQTETTTITGTLVPPLAYPYDPTSSAGFTQKFTKVLGGITYLYTFTTADMMYHMVAVHAVKKKYTREGEKQLEIMCGIGIYDTSALLLHFSNKAGGKTNLSTRGTKQLQRTSTYTRSML